MTQNLVIGIILIIIGWFIITRKKFTLQRRLTTTILSVATILLLTEIAPLFNLTVDVGEQIFWIIGTIIIASFVSDIIYRKKRI